MKEEAKNCFQMLGLHGSSLVKDWAQLSGADEVTGTCSEQRWSSRAIHISILYLSCQDTQRLSDTESMLGFQKKIYTVQT